MRKARSWRAWCRVRRASFAIASFLKPFFALFVIAVFCAPVKRLVQRRMKPGRLKRLLLLELDPEKSSRNAGKHPLSRGAE